MATRHAGTEIITIGHSWIHLISSIAHGLVDYVRDPVRAL